MKGKLIQTDGKWVLVNEVKDIIKSIPEKGFYIDDRDTIRVIIMNDDSYWINRMDYKIIIAGYNNLPPISSEADLYSLYKKAVDEKEAENLAFKTFPDSHIIESKIGRQGVVVGYLTKAKYHYSEDVSIGFGIFANKYFEDLSKPEKTLDDILTGKQLFHLYLQTLLPHEMDCEYSVTDEKIIITKINL